MWYPYSLGTLSNLSKHNNTVQDLAINELKNNFIRLGTDKEVINWALYCKKSRDIILGSRRMQFEVKLILSNL
jgi:hypothetical protein